MLVSVLVRRTASQRATAVLSWWAVGQGSHEMVRVTWDPAGPMTAREAAVEALSKLLEELMWRAPGVSDPECDLPPAAGG